MDKSRFRGDVATGTIPRALRIHKRTAFQRKKLREKLVIDRGEISKQQRKRKIPYDKPQEVSSILQLSKLRHSQLAVKWAFGRFRLLSTSFWLGQVLRMPEHRLVRQVLLTASVLNTWTPETVYLISPQDARNGDKSFVVVNK